MNKKNPKLIFRPSVLKFTEIFEERHWDAALKCLGGSEQVEKSIIFCGFQR
jgi:hypothetical protein